MTGLHCHQKLPLQMQGIALKTLQQRHSWVEAAQGSCTDTRRKSWGVLPPLRPSVLFLFQLASGNEACGDEARIGEILVERPFLTKTRISVAESDIREVEVHQAKSHELPYIYKKEGLNFPSSFHASMLNNLQRSCRGHQRGRKEDSPGKRVLVEATSSASEARISS